MTDQGKYYRQRLKARDVLRLYAAGERDFRGAILRGCNFRGADLSSADFRGADIRSTRFVDATLRHVNFSHARGGLRFQRGGLQMLLVVVIATIFGFLQAFGGTVIGAALVNSDREIVAAGVAGLIAAVVVFFAIARQGFTLQTLDLFRNRKNRQVTLSPVSEDWHLGILSP